MVDRKTNMQFAPETVGVTAIKFQDNAVPEPAAARVGKLIFSDYYTTRDKLWAIGGGVGIGAVLGVLTRIALGVLASPFVDPPGSTGRDGEIVQEIIPNMVGCFVMGMAVELRPLIQPMHPTVYAAVTTGFCGCCTTYSSYNTAMVLILLRSGNVSQGIGCASMALAIGAATAWSSLQAGRFLARQPPPQLTARAGAAHVKLASILAMPGSKREDVMHAVGVMAEAMDELQSSAPAVIETLHEIPSKWIRHKLVFYWCCLIAGAIFVIIQVFRSIENLTPLIVSVSVAPLGAWVRYVAGFQNQHYRIPRYTLLCNLVASLGSALLSYVLDASCNPEPSQAPWHAVFKGLSTGFCGSLSTVSTFVDEVRRLGNQHRGRAVVYASSTILGGAAVAIAALVPFYYYHSCWSAPQ